MHSSSCYHCESWFFIPKQKEIPPQTPEDIKKLSQQEVEQKMTQLYSQVLLHEQLFRQYKNRANPAIAITMVMGVITMIALLLSLCTAHYTDNLHGVAHICAMVAAEVGPCGGCTALLCGLVHLNHKKQVAVANHCKVLLKQQTELQIHSGWIERELSQFDQHLQPLPQEWIHHQQSPVTPSPTQPLSFIIKRTAYQDSKQNSEDTGEDPLQLFCTHLSKPANENGLGFTNLRLVEEESYGIMGKIETGCYFGTRLAYPADDPQQQIAVIFNPKTGLLKFVKFSDQSQDAVLITQSGLKAMLKGYQFPLPLSCIAKVQCSPQVDIKKLVQLSRELSQKEESVDFDEDPLDEDEEITNIYKKQTEILANHQLILYVRQGVRHEDDEDPLKDWVKSLQEDFSISMKKSLVGGYIGGKILSGEKQKSSSLILLLNSKNEFLEFTLSVR